MISAIIMTLLVITALWLLSLEYLNFVVVNANFEAAIAALTGYTSEIAVFLPLSTLFVIIGLIISFEATIILLKLFFWVANLRPKA